jgi:hypothetical protein
MNKQLETAQRTLIKRVERTDFYSLSTTERILQKRSMYHGSFFKIVASYIIGNPPMGSHKEWDELIGYGETRTELGRWIYGE